MAGMEDKNKKYELTGETLLDDGVKLHRIRAVRDFTLCNGATVRAGELGGWLENDGNLSHLDSAWVFGNARVFGGCFSGTLEEFAARVEETHEGQALFLAQYRSMVQFFRWMRETALCAESARNEN